jgi:hypothetical protein
MVIYGPALYPTPVPLAKPERSPYCTDPAFPQDTEDQFAYVTTKFIELENYVKHLLFKNADLLGCPGTRQQGLKIYSNLATVTEDLKTFKEVAWCVPDLTVTSVTLKPPTNRLYSLL